MSNINQRYAESIVLMEEKFKREKKQREQQKQNEEHKKQQEQEKRKNKEKIRQDKLKKELERKKNKNKAKILSNKIIINKKKYDYSYNQTRYFNWLKEESNGDKELIKHNKQINHKLQLLINKETNLRRKYKNSSYFMNMVNKNNTQVGFTNMKSWEGTSSKMNLEIQKKKKSQEKSQEKSTIKNTTLSLIFKSNKTTRKKTPNFFLNFSK